MDAVGLEAMVELDGGWGAQLEGALDRLQRPYPGRFAVFAGIDETAISAATTAGVRAACALGRDGGILAIDAGNYGGKLGPHHFHLRRLLG